MTLLQQASAPFVPHLLFALSLFFVLLGCQGNSSAAPVLRIIDGDTIEVQLASGQRATVRYIGIDTPEVSGSPECYGKEATQKNRDLVEGKRVALEKDVSERDRFGRLLRYVYADGRLINGELVREGYARAVAYPPDVKLQPLLRSLEQEARAKGWGLWGACDGSTATPVHAGAPPFVSRRTATAGTSLTTERLSLYRYYRLVPKTQDWYNGKDEFPVSAGAALRG